MKRVDANRIKTTVRLSTAVALATALLFACAPPPATDRGLQQELKLLRQQQQEQQQSMHLLQEQLAQLQKQLQIEPSTADPLQGVEPFEPTPAGAEQAATLQPVEVARVEIILDAATRYLEAFSALAMGHYQQAEEGFSGFLADYAEHRYAPHARYWLAESEIALGQTERAEENLLQVANNPADDSKAPAALLRLAQLYQEQNLTVQADDILHQLRSRFPESREAQHSNRSSQER